MKALILFIFSLSCFGAQSLTMEFIKTYEDSNQSFKAALNDVNLTNKNISILPEKNIPTRDDYAFCQRKFSNSFIEVDGVKAIAIGEHLAISTSEPNHFIKHDPINGIYLIRTKERLNYPAFKSIHNLKIGDYIASVSMENINMGNLLGFSSKQARASFMADLNGIIFSASCLAYGVGMGKDQFLTGDYIAFLSNPKVNFDGYVGANFVEKRGKVYVLDLDLFYKDLHFCPNDEIISVNGVKIDSKKELKHIILTSQVGKELNFSIRRNGKIMHVKVLVGVSPKENISDLSYLEQVGIYLNHALEVYNITPHSIGSRNELLPGDKLLKVQDREVSDLRELRERLIFNPHEAYRLMFDRNGFWFFVNFNKSDLKGDGFAIPMCQ